METRARAAIAILASSVLLGFAGDSLLRVDPLGHSIVVWIGLLMIFGGAIAIGYKLESVRHIRWMILPTVLFCAGISLRDSDTLRSLNLLGLASVFGIAFMRSTRGKVLYAKVSDYLVIWIGWLFIALGRFFFLFDRDVPWKQMSNSEHGAKYRSVSIGLLVAVPLLLIFGGLFVSADAVIKSITIDRLHFDAERIVTAIVLVPLFAWLGGSCLRQLLISEQASPPVVQQTGYRLGRIELGIIFGSVVVLFLAFIFVQIGYLFGGDERVQRIAGLTYAEYARNGFFELVTVSGIATIVILSLQSLHNKDDESTHKLFLVLSGLFIVEQFVVLASASQRMALYIRAYGMSELRFYVGAAIAWLFLSLIWLLATNSFRKTNAFAFGALLSLYATVWVSVALNPDRLVATYNIERDKNLDIAYLCGLSCDAVPPIMANLDRLPKAKQKEAAYYLTIGPAAKDFQDWRTMNYGRYQAAWSLYGQRERLKRLSKGFEPPAPEHGWD